MYSQFISILKCVQIFLIRCRADKDGCKVQPRIGHEGPEGEERYSSTLPLTSALDGVGDQHHAPSALPLGKTRYPLCRRLGGFQGRSEQVRKISPPPGFDPPTGQLGVGLYYLNCHRHIISLRVYRISNILSSFIHLFFNSDVHSENRGCL
jgi:hypothetical protein